MMTEITGGNDEGMDSDNTGCGGELFCVGITGWI
jgi:hypothetical protein